MLDINTPKGQESLKCEKYVIDLIKNKWINYQINIIETDKKKESRIDNLIIKENKLIALAEIKCRNMTLIEMNYWGNTWLVTNQKIIDGATISKLLAVPFYGFLYLQPEDKILGWKITNEKGMYLFDFDIKKTKTQATCNGGEIYRDNAYLPISKARFV